MTSKGTGTARFQRGRRVAGGCALALWLAAGPAQADSADLDWLGIAYLWGSGITIDAREQSVGIDFDDLVDDLEIAFMGRVEAQGDDFGGFVDVMFVGVGDRESRTLADVNVDNDVTAMDLALIWSPGTARATGLELYGGLRYVNNDFRIVVDPLPPGPPESVGGSDKSYTDALLGARYLAPLSDHWRFTVNADLSGGDTEGTWSLGAYGSYLMSQHRFIVGYKHLEMELESGGGDELTVTMSGPVLAYGFAF
jgi:hypothetical protein